MPEKLKSKQNIIIYKLDKHLHIVSFNVPLPANYGGVIDVYYKIKALHQEGIKIILHCFLYDRVESHELENCCEKVFYYPRKRRMIDFFYPLPFIVATRKHPDLLKNLVADEYPILVEGLHCCGFLNHPKLKNKKKLVRTHNIEHQYYGQLAKNEPNIFKRFYFNQEALKLKRFEKYLAFADNILVISKYDELYFKKLFKHVKLIPPFHQYQEGKIEQTVSNYVLFNADFNISTNFQFAKALNSWAKSADKNLILAGKIDFVKTGNLQFIKNPTDLELDHLIGKAFINIISVEQQTGFKMKLVHALYRSRNIVVVGFQVEELSDLNCSQVKHINFLHQLNKVYNEFEADQSSHQEIVSNRLSAIKFFNQGLNLLNLISLV